MSYASASYLIEQFSAEEVAQRADRAVPRLVSAEMIKIAAAGGSLAAYTSDEQTATLAALASIESKLKDADSTIDGYLAGRYGTPLTIVPRLVMTIACDLARYALYDDVATELITKRYNDAIKMLESISKGVINLGVNDAQVAVPESSGVKFSAPDRVFNDQSLADY